MIPARTTCKGCVYLKPLGGMGRTNEQGVPLLLYHRQPKGMPCRSMRQVRGEAKNP